MRFARSSPDDFSIELEPLSAGHCASARQPTAVSHVPQASEGPQTSRSTAALRRRRALALAACGLAILGLTASAGERTDRRRYGTPGRSPEALISRGPERQLPASPRRRGPSAGHPEPPLLERARGPRPRAPKRARQDWPRPATRRGAASSRESTAAPAPSRPGSHVPRAAEAPVPAAPAPDSGGALPASAPGSGGEFF
jgi:hypothetical protein